MALHHLVNSVKVRYLVHILQAVLFYIYKNISIDFYASTNNSSKIPSIQIAKKMHQTFFRNLVCALQSRKDMQMFQVVLPYGYQHLVKISQTYLLQFTRSWRGSCLKRKISLTIVSLSDLQPRTAVFRKRFVMVNCIYNFGQLNRIQMARAFLYLGHRQVYDHFVFYELVLLYIIAIGHIDSRSCTITREPQLVGQAFWVP